MQSHPLYAEAMVLFARNYMRAQQCGLKEPTAVALATSDLRGRPAARMVLLKGFDDRGFVFFTNLESRKGRQLIENPHAALCFHWPPLDEQVIVEGSTSIVETAEADAYWQTRPRDSQIGAWASQQSRPLDDRRTLERRVVEFEAKYPKGPIPRPPHWTGFRLAPNRFEFWKAQPHRLHERTVIEWDGKDWKKNLLYP